MLLLPTVSRRGSTAAGLALELVVRADDVRAPFERVPLLPFFDAALPAVDDFAEDDVFAPVDFDAAGRLVGRDGSVSLGGGVRSSTYGVYAPRHAQGARVALATAR